MIEEQKGSNIVQFPKNNNNEEYHLLFLERIWKTLEKYFSKLDEIKVKNKRINFIFSISVMMVMIIEILIKELVFLFISIIKTLLNIIIKIVKFIYKTILGFLKFFIPFAYKKLMKALTILYDSFILFFTSIKRV